MRAWVCALLGGLCVVIPCAGCDRRSDSGSGRSKVARDANVLLITLDTTRADRLGCYGYLAAATPTLDALAARGTLFERAYAQVPLTLPSHCSILTGRYPREHGVRVNGRDALGEAHPTLAGIFKTSGHRTGAFLSSVVLGRRFRLDRGFDIYDDAMTDTTPDRPMVYAQLPADVVTDRALKWLDAGTGEPFFCWVHYYDPHHPHEPPDEFLRRHADPYDAEIAFVDSQLARLVSWIDDRELSDNTLIVVVADHGESFGEHGEFGHTRFLYQTNLMIPMIFVYPATVPAARRVATPVEAVDVFPTVLELFGYEAPEGLLSRSLTGAFTGGELVSRPAFAECDHSKWSFGWAEQRAMISGRWKYISSTRPELFDIIGDPGEQRDIVSARPKIAAQLRDALVARFNAMEPSDVSAVDLDPAARKQLETLGYIGGGLGAGTDAFLTPGLPDPKDMLEVWELDNRARNLPPDEAIPLLEQAVRLSPKSMILHYRLGEFFNDLGQSAAAILSLDRALRIDPAYASALKEITDALRATGRGAEVLRYYRASLALVDNDPRVHAALAKELRTQGESDEAERHFLRATELDPNYADAHGYLAEVMQARGDLKGAIRGFERAADLDRRNARLRLNLARALMADGRTSDASTYLREALSLEPGLGAQAANRAVELANDGNVAQAEAWLDVLCSIEGVDVAANFNLGIMLSRRGAVDRAIEHFERVLALEPSHERAVLSLHKAYASRQAYKDMVRVLRCAVTAAPDNPVLMNTLAALLATCEDDTIRSGDEAVVLAERAARVTNRAHPAVLAVLAAAQAESGSFEMAIRVGLEALELAESSGNKHFANLIRKQIQGYRAGKPYRHRDAGQ